tara:strand:- start:76 stop:330 length:255 start_codon:yes stop_codon:yes gene_type:complete
MDHCNSPHYQRISPLLVLGFRHPFLPYHHPYLRAYSYLHPCHQIQLKSVAGPNRMLELQVDTFFLPVLGFHIRLMVVCSHLVVV